MKKPLKPPMQRQLVFASLFLLFAGGAVRAPVFSQAKQGAAMTEAIDGLVAPFEEIGHLSGTLLVARQDTVIYERSFGSATNDPNIPNTTATSFNVASVMKPITAAIAYQLIDEGKLEKEAPIARYLPDFPRGDEILVRHLMFHQSGLPHRVTTEAQEQEQQTAASVTEIAAKAELDFTPGKKRQYSSAGYSVLARVLELATGKSYSELLLERVVKPLELQATAHPSVGVELPKKIESFRFSSAGVVRAPSRNYSFLVGAGSLYSTPRDLHKMMRALVAGRFGESAKVGLVRLGKLEWGGFTDGYRAFADYSSKGELSVVFTGNLNSGAVDYLRDAIPKVIAGEAAPALPQIFSTAVAVALEDLERAEGTYEAPGQTLELTIENGTLYASGWPLLAIGKGEFFSPTDYGTIQVVFDDSGKAKQLDWTRGAAPFTYTRQSP